jgi:signal transduction histidine kinase
VNYKNKTKDELIEELVYLKQKLLAEELRKKIDENNRLLSETIEYDKLKTEFFSNISHEFRTPLNVVSGVLQLLDIQLKDSMPVNKEKKISNYLFIMKQNYYRLLRLVNNMIDITKIDSHYFDINLQNCNIVSVIEETTLSVAEYIEKKGISLEFDTDVEEKIMACDADKIERIMLNLLSNAVKFTKPGGSITVKTQDADDCIIISVKDTGIGIPSDKLNVIFERFRQVDRSLTRSHEGSGIGLSLVKSLVQMHEGNIFVKSEYGKGSEFVIILPVKVVPWQDKQLDRVYNVGHGRVEKINIEFSDIYL